ALWSHQRIGYANNNDVPEAFSQRLEVRHVYSALAAASLDVESLGYMVGHVGEDGRFIERIRQRRVPELADGSCGQRILCVDRVEEVGVFVRIEDPGEPLEASTDRRRQTYFLGNLLGFRVINHRRAWHTKLGLRHRAKVRGEINGTDRPVVVIAGN